MSGFNFGATASSSGSSPSLFGTSNAAPASGANSGSLFGSTNAGTGSGSLGFNFGAPSQNATSPGTEAPKSLFGSTTNNSSNSNFFGKPASAAPLPTFSFGTKPNSEQPSTNAPAASPFGGFGTPDKSSTPTTSAPSLFGSTTPAAGSNATNLFGGLSTTPAGPPPTSVGFGASTGGANMFGQNKSGQDTSKPAATPFSFGKTAETTTAKEPTSTGLFGNTQPAASAAPGLFAPKPATSGAFSFGPPAKPADRPAEATNTTSAPSTGFSFGQSAKAVEKPAEGAAAPPAFSGFSLGAPSQSADKSNEPSTTSATTAPAGQRSLFNFGPPSSTSPATTTSSSASASTATASAPSSSAPSLFGTAPPSSKPTPPLFGSAPTAPAASAAASQGSTPFFGKPAAASSSDATPKPGFSFPSATPQSANNTTSTTAPSAAKPLFGAAIDSTSKAAASTNFFGQPATSASTPASAAPATSGTAPTTATAPFSFAGATSASAPQAAATSTDPRIATSTAGPVPPAQSRLRNKTMDEILTRWATDLTRYQKEFKQHAETVAKWDQMIVDTSSKIDKLYVKTRTCEKQTLSVEMQLAAVENQQAELESWLDKYEKDVDEMLAKEGSMPGELGGPDQEREKTYKLAEKLGERLDDMGRDLESMVEEVNAANASLGKNGRADEPITQIVKILNSHLSQLQAIDQGTAALQAKVIAAQKASNGLGYHSGAANGDGRAAVEDFYRSYMGKR